MPECKSLTSVLSTQMPNVWSPCCAFRANAAAEYSFPISEFSFSEYKNSNFYLNLKQTQSSGWHPGCENCRVRESVGLESTRQMYQHLPSNGDDIVHLDLYLNNTCNITCRMCDPTFSSAWARVYKQLKLDIPPIKKGIPTTVEKLLDGLDLSKIQFIKLAGGEPVIMPETFELFRYLGNHSKNINLTFNTNVTVFPEKLMPYIEQFKSVLVSVSIDGVGSMNDYIRTGSKWETVSSVLDNWMTVRSKNKNLSINASSCVMAYNVQYISELRNFLNSYNIEMLENIVLLPEYIGFSVLPDNYKKFVIDKLQLDSRNSSIISALEATTFNKIMYEKFIDYTVALDNKFNQKLKEVSPDFARFINFV